MNGERALHHQRVGEGLKVGYYAVSDPGGLWRFEHLAGGPGVAFASGVSYHANHVSLSS